MPDRCGEGIQRIPANGSFVQQARNRAKDLYWYYRGYERTFDGSPGSASKKYIGPVGDPDIEAIVADHAELRTSYLSRRQLVSRLKRAGLPAPHPTEGAVARVLSDAGILASGSTIVGSVAFQTYGGLLNIRPDISHYRTLDIDVAQPRGLRLSPGKADANDILEALKRADPSFAPMHHIDEPKLIAGYRNATNFRLEFLTPQMKFLEFSLKDPIRSVMLHEAGILVPVPQPARFAVHKLIVAAIRGANSSESTSKSFKDVLQTQTILDGISNIRDPLSVGDAWLEAWNTGPKWRKALRTGTLRLSVKHLGLLRDAVDEAAVMLNKASPFEADDDPRKALLIAGVQKAREPISDDTSR